MLSHMKSWTDVLAKNFLANRTHTDSPVFSGWTDIVQTVLSEGNSSAVLKIMIRGLNYEDL